jgi:hypothetical protein
MIEGGVIFEIRELAGINPVKTPLYAKNDQYNEDGGVTIYFVHKMCSRFLNEE